MNLKYITLYVVALCLIAFIISGCEDSTDSKPLDIIKGNVDLQQEYYKSILTNPIQISGYVTNRTTQDYVANVKVTARLENSTTSFNTTTKKDGSFNLFVEGNESYIIVGEKEGFDKSYGYPTFWNDPLDTTIYVSSAQSFEIKMRVHDATPTFEVNEISSNIVDDYLNDLSFDGTDIIGINSSYFMHYNTSGKYLTSTSFVYGSYVGCQDADIYWTGVYDNSTLYKIDSETGEMLDYVDSEISASKVDMEVFNNNIWLLTYNTLFKLSMTGSLLKSFAFDEGIVLIGITHKNDHIYVLCYNEFAKYVLYKLDTASLEIKTKGYLSMSPNDVTLKGLTFDGTNFWTINSTYWTLDQFSIIE